MQGHERRGTGGVDRNARPGEVEVVGESVGEHGNRCPGIGPGIHLGEVSGCGEDVLVSADPDKDPDRASRDLAGKQTGILESVACDFQEHLLLGIHACSFGGRDSEVLGVEPEGIINKSRVPGDAFLSQV